MKRLLLTILVALAVPGAAQAKELTGFQLCGPDGCTGGRMTGFGHDGPFDAAGGGYPAPPPGPYYTLHLEIDGHPDAWVAYYEPETGLVAYKTEQAWMTWNRVRPRFASRVKEAALTIAPFPPPTVAAVRIGGRTASGDLDSYLSLFALDGPPAFPRSPDSDVIDLESARPDPWTDGQLLYYPDEDIVQISAGRTIRVPAGMAEDLEAARTLGGGNDLPVMPVLVLAAVALGLALAVAAAAWRLRGRSISAPAARPEAA